jgi:osmotically-inducible protein OsmY
MMLPTESSVPGLNSAIPRSPCAVAGAVLKRHGIRDAHVDEVGPQMYLHGIASCYKSKQEAAKGVADALPGRVVINELHVVHEPTGDSSVSESVAAAIRDAAPETVVHVRVFTLSGEVYLRGVVSSADLRQRIEAAAWASSGVMHVHNELTTLDHPVEDHDLEREITASLIRVINVPAGSVTVSCTGGIVALGGDVASAEQRDMIEELVRWHDAVRDVTNNLRVRQRPNLS